MKKTLFLAALVLMSAGCFAQKSNVKKAKNLALQETPDFIGARAAIDEALRNPETANLPETWYVAGLIGYQENAAETMKQMIGSAYDEEIAGKAAIESFDYWIKAASLASCSEYTPSSSRSPSPSASCLSSALRRTSIRL